VSACDPSDHVFYINASFATIQGFTIQNVKSAYPYRCGAYLDHVNCCSISDNIFLNIYPGTAVRLCGSNETKISNNTLSSNGDGISLEDSSNHNVVSHNNLTLHGYGMHITNGSSYNLISGNFVSKTKLVAIRLEWEQYPPRSPAMFNIITDNVLHDNEYGIFLDYPSYDNTVCRNTIFDNDVGIDVRKSYNNTIFHNNLINNTINARRREQESLNTWDNGYPSGGNYWSDYKGTDSHSGHYQNVTGSDGIGDEPYVIDANNTDRYPLMHPWKPSILGDVNDDGTVNMLDLYEIGLSFGFAQGDPGWNADADLNEDGIINMLDLYLCAANFGKYPLEIQLSFSLFST
jgi:parallel beta-helix repeat protein